MKRIILNGRTVDVEDPSAQLVLKRAYESNQRPNCTCRPRGAPMYLALYGGAYIVKRMPGTGRDHDPDCEAYEAPPEASGLSEVAGRAIKEDAAKGTTELRLDFALKKVKGKAPPAAELTGASGSAKSDGGKLTMRALLHYLWEQAGFNRWHPNMDGRRSWSVIRKYIHDRAIAMLAKGNSLGSQMYLPETWTEKEKDQLRQRRLTQLRSIARPNERGGQLALLVAELKSINPYGNAYRLTVKHVPDAMFLVPSDLYKRATRRFATALSLKESNDTIRVIVIATLSLDPALTVTVEEISLMATTHDWIPVESVFDEILVSKLVNEKRRFMKGLRYNLPDSAPLATLIVTDTTPATACYIIDASSSDAYIQALDELQEESHYQRWVWNLNDGELPPLPVPASQNNTAESSHDRE